MASILVLTATKNDPVLTAALNAFAHTGWLLLTLFSPV